MRKNHDKDKIITAGYTWLSTWGPLLMILAAGLFMMGYFIADLMFGITEDLQRVKTLLNSFAK